MQRDEFFKLIGANAEDADYVPLALLLRSGYACAGYCNAVLNAEFDRVCVILNAQLIELKESKRGGRRPSIEDFGEFLEVIVGNYAESKEDESPALVDDSYGRKVPLTAIPFDEIAVVYPVAYIEQLISRTKKQGKNVPTFFDFEKSEILRLLRGKLW